MYKYGKIEELEGKENRVAVREGKGQKIENRMALSEGKYKK